MMSTERSRLFGTNCTIPPSAPSVFEAKARFRFSTASSGSRERTGTSAKDMPFMTLTSNTATASRIEAISCGLPDRTRALRV